VSLGPKPGEFVVVCDPSITRSSITLLASNVVSITRSPHRRGRVILRVAS
jgi:hypothetical protein